MKIVVLLLLSVIGAGCASAPRAMINGDGARQASNPNQFDTRLIAVDGEYLSSAWSDRAPIQPGRRTVLVESMQPLDRGVDQQRRLPLRRSIDIDVPECAEVRLKAVNHPFWTSRFEVEVAEVRALPGCEGAGSGNQPSA